MVKFINWWGQPTEGVIQDSWFENFFQRCCEDYEDADHNKINIYSVFGNMNAISSSNKSEANLFFTGENTFNMHRTFNNENFISQHVDIIAGFFKSTSKSIRFPLWMIYWRFDLNGLFSPKISETRSEDAIIISNHTANGLRTRGVEIIKSLGIKVYCNRTDVFPMAISVKVLPNSVGKIETLKNYKYNICFENSLQEGYTTEKIFEALAGGTIPIYFGNNPVEPNILYACIIL